MLCLSLSLWLCVCVLFYVCNSTEDTPQALRSEDVQKLNQENIQHSYDKRSHAEASLSDVQLQESKEPLAPVSEDTEREAETGTGPEVTEAEVTEAEALLEKPTEKDGQEPEKLEREAELGDVATQTHKAAKDEEVKKEEDKDVDEALPQAALPDSSPR